MSRRVIFPDPDIWTQPKENTAMSEDATPTTPADYRRAAVLTLHHRQGNDPGLVAIIDETNAAGRAAHLVYATLHLHEGFISTLRTQDGINLLADYVHGMANLDAVEPPGLDIRRAARMLECYGKKDFEGIDREISEAIADRRLTEAFRQLLDLYEVSLPELSSTVGIKWIQDHIAALANEEVQGDG